MSLERHSHARVMRPPAQRVRGNNGTANAQADTTKKASKRCKDKAADTSDVGGGAAVQVLWQTEQRQAAAAAEREEREQQVR